MFLSERDDFLGLLIRNRAESQLSHRFAWNHGLGARPLIAGAEAVDLRRWAGPKSLQCAKSGFAKERRRACFLQDLRIRIDRDLAPGLAFPLLQRRDGIVKAG